MTKVYFTLTGTNYHQGSSFLKEGMKVTLKKDHDNEYDTEAIQVYLKGMGVIGHVANSVRTRIGESWSAGRLYDRIGEEAVGTVKYIVHNSAVCSIKI